MSKRCIVLLMLACLAAACDEKTSVFTSAMFNMRRAAQDLYAIPYPNDVRLQPDQTIDLAGIEKDQLELIKLYVETVIANRLGGFACGGAIHIRFNNTIDTTSLPQTPRESLLPGSSLFLVNIDKASPEYAQRVPLRWKYSVKAQRYIGANSLAVLPARGFILAPNTTYAVVATEALSDRLGDSVQPDADFRLLLDDKPPTDTSLARAHAAYTPLRRYLDDVGMTGIVTATVLTTGRPTELAGLARQVVHGLPTPAAKGLSVVGEEASHYEVEGTYEAPNFQTGAPPYLKPADGGVFKLDASGKPVAQRTEVMRFALSVPKGEMPAAGWPVVIYAHGTGGSYRTFMNTGVAKSLAEVKDDDGGVIAGLAAVGIDQVLHGPRSPQGSVPELTFFNLQNPAAAVHNVIQAGVDNFSLLRMIKELTFDRLRWAEGADKQGLVRFDPPVKFNPKRVLFMGHSQGSLTGPVFLAHEPTINAVVLSGAGGGAVLGLLEKTAPITIKPLLAAALGEDPDEFHPMMALVQQMLEAADTANYGRHLIRAPVKGVGPKSVFLSQGFVDHYTPNATTDALAVTIGLPLAGTAVRAVDNLALANLADVALPLAGNLQAGGEAVTGALLQYRAALKETACKDDGDCDKGDYCEVSEGRCADDGHYVVFGRDDATRQYSRFLATAARDGVPVIVE
jgi:hypothetical protein